VPAGQLREKIHLCPPRVCPVSLDIGQYSSNLSAQVVAIVPDMELSIDFIFQIKWVIQMAMYGIGAGKQEFQGEWMSGKMQVHCGVRPRTRVLSQ
jgi:hypothetical protein